MLSGDVNENSPPPPKWVGLISKKKKNLALACSTQFIYIFLPCIARHYDVKLPKTSYLHHRRPRRSVCQYINIHMDKMRWVLAHLGGGGWAYNRMYVLFTGRRAYSGGGRRGGAMADPDLQIRGGSSSPWEKGWGGEQFQKNFSALVCSKNKGGCARTPPLDPPLGGFYNRQFTVVNRSPTIANNIRGRGRLSWG